MITPEMATPKITGRKKPAGRKKSKLTLAGEAAQRGLLLQALKECDWNLSRTAESLDVVDASSVLRSIKLLGLEDEYEAAKVAGKARPGRPPEVT